MAKWNILLETSDAPSEEDIAGLRALLRAGSATESECHKFLFSHPSLLVPLGFRSVLNECTLPNRSDSQKPPERIDFVGLRFQLRPISVFVELKGPNDPIVNAGYLSQAARGLIDQLRSRVVAIGHRSVQQEIESKLSSNWKNLAGDEFCRLADSIGTDPGSWSDESISKGMLALLRHRVEFIGIIGTATQFATPGARANAQQRFLERGCRLVCFDDLLWAAERFRELVASDISMLEVLAKMLSPSAGPTCAFISSSSDAVTHEIRRDLVYRAMTERENVCLIGTGQPPEPDHGFVVNAFFDIRQVEAPPLFLGGEELLLWAGQWNGRWIVAKWRLTEPCMGGIIWYEFGAPVAAGAITGGMSNG